MHLCIYLFIHPCIRLSICPTVYSSSQPASHTFNKYLLSADDMPGPAGQSLLWGGAGQVMSRRELRFASLPAGTLPKTGADLPLESLPPRPGLPGLVRREVALGSQLGKPSLTICS